MSYVELITLAGGGRDRVGKLKTSRRRRDQGRKCSPDWACVYETLGLNYPRTLLPLTFALPDTTSHTRYL
jgi:hypothetical protein